MIFVIDASAMIAFLCGEPGADVAAEILMDAESRCYAHALNLCEVFYDFERAASRERALQAVADLAEMNVVEDANLSSPVWQAAGVAEGSATAGLLGRLLCDRVSRPLGGDHCNGRSSRV